MGILKSPALLEALLIGLGFCVYFAVRSTVADEHRAAYLNALWIIDAEQSLGLFGERGLNEWVEGSAFWAKATSLVYFWLLFPLMIALGAWLYATQRHKYTVMRDAFFSSGALGLVFFLLFPAAPPRLLAGLAPQFDATPPPEVFGFVDTVRLHLRCAHESGSTGLWVNEYGAMPCMHAGWDLLLGVAVVWAFWSTGWRWPAFVAGAALPVIQSVAVVATANHYFLDVGAGLVVSALGIPAAIALQRHVYAGAGRLARGLTSRPPVGDAAGAEAG